MPNAIQVRALPLRPMVPKKIVYSGASQPKCTTPSEHHNKLWTTTAANMQVPAIRATKGGKERGEGTENKTNYQSFTFKTEIQE